MTQPQYYVAALVGFGPDRTTSSRSGLKQGSGRNIGEQEKHY